MSDAPLLPEALPAWGSSLVGMPPWTPSASIDSASWIPSPDFSGGAQIDEVGYDQGGYGEDGYDAQTITFPTASQPNWTIDLLK